MHDMAHRPSPIYGRRTRYRPPTPTPAGDDQHRLLDALITAGVLYRLLDTLLPEPDSRGIRAGTIGRHAFTSGEPWQAEAAHAYWAIHFGIRKLANRMRYSLGVDQYRWPGSTEATDHALTQVANYAATVGPDVLADARHEVEGWVSRAKQIRDIDEEEPWQPIHLQDAPPPTCPYCKKPSLRMQKLRGVVRCFSPVGRDRQGNPTDGCRDLDDRPTRARMDRGRMTGEAALFFDDGTVVHYRDHNGQEAGTP
jgi:hypothetical protein